MDAHTLYYTPGQLRDSIGLSKEAFRHWKRVVPAFSSGRGHAPNFSLGDVVASAVLRRLTDFCGVRISHLCDVTPSIFQVCNAASLEVLQEQVLLIELARRTCVVVGDASLIPIDDLTLVCPLAPIVKMVQRELLKPSVRNKSERPPITTLRRSLRKAAR